MLESIVLNNYTTFMNETTFSFKATNYKILEDTNVGDHRILKGALFVGENASGKTQTIRAIMFLLNLLLENSDMSYLRYKSFYTKGSKYELKYTFQVKGSKIVYEIGLEENNIDFEKLYIDEELMLERIKNVGKIYIKGQEKTMDDLNLQLSLLKTEYYNTKFNNHEVLNAWFDFLKNSIYINCLDKKSGFYNPNRREEQNIFTYARKNSEKKLNDLVEKLGYDSEFVFIKENEKSEKEQTNIRIRKKGTDIAVPLVLESAGNIALTNTILPIYFATQNDCMLLVDEFSSGLHNELEEALIKFFFNHSKNSQIFFTSHSTNLLKNTILRPDQIYSFRFDPKKGTLIKRFSDEDPRESQNLEKMYLNGVFNGMPQYNKEFKN